MNGNTLIPFFVLRMNDYPAVFGHRLRCMASVDVGLGLAMFPVAELP